ncbi:MAG: class I SAM-dependent methyltransferase [Spirochaetia bacterium]|nr:class I SAM-dependent methyltransferase [Spirochaetia bacterium]
MASERDIRQRDYFLNRAVKRDRHLAKWARKNDTTCYRVYDRDIPEIPLALDRYGDAAVLYLYERPYDKDPADEQAWLELMKSAASEALGVEPSAVHVKQRRRLGLDEQYGRMEERGSTLVVREQGLHFRVNLSDYLDTGLFMDHRPGRSWIRERAAGKRVLNLFCYTGSFSVYALAGGASMVSAVDLSRNYLDWALDNLALNGLPVDRYEDTRADVLAWLEAARGRVWDLIVLDPPTFSNSKGMDRYLDVNRHWADLVNAALAVLAPDGLLLFSSNSRQLKFDAGLLHGASTEDISARSVPQDYRPGTHRAWLIGHAGA